MLDECVVWREILSVSHSADNTIIRHCKWLVLGRIRTVLVLRNECSRYVMLQMMMRDSQADLSVSYTFVCDVLIALPLCRS